MRYITALEELKAYGRMPLPMIKKYLLAVNLVAAKVVDGVGRTILKSDIKIFAGEKT